MTNAILKSLRTIRVGSLLENYSRYLIPIGHVVYCARHPDPQSDFDLKTKDIRELPDHELMAKLMERNYDGLLFYKDEVLIGHAYWQTHEEGRVWKLFSVFVQKNLQHCGFGTEIVKKFLILSQRSDAKEVEIGAGGNNLMIHIWENILANKIDLPFKVTAGATPGSIIFLNYPNQSRPFL